jgi:two-component system phosphate regulon sensor histidine kinase PhoR
MRTRFRTKVFLASLISAAAALALVTIIMTRDLRREERSAIERRVTEQALLIAELLSQRTDLQSPARIDEEADRLAMVVGARVTLVAQDGRVLGDSALDGEALQDLENHLMRPELAHARERAVGVVERYSTTQGLGMLYAAVPTAHDTVGYVRVALPLTDVAEQMGRVAQDALLAFALAAPVAIALAWVTSVLVSRRVDAIAAAARRHATADAAPSRHDYGADELGAVAHALDASLHQLAERLQEQSRDRARMEAILTGMVEGVLVVDRQGRLQLVNRAAQEMLHVAASEGRPFVVVIRHPDIAARLAAALEGKPGQGTELTTSRDPERTFLARAAPVSSSGGGGAVLVLRKRSRPKPVCPRSIPINVNMGITLRL